MKNERPMIQISLRDNSGEISIMLMSNIYAKTDDRVLKEGNLIALKGKLSGFRNSGRTGFDVETVFSLADCGRQIAIAFSYTRRRDMQTVLRLRSCRTW